MAYLHNAMTDCAILPFPQKHQAGHNHSCYGHCDHQQANQYTATEAEVFSQRAVGLLTGRMSQGKTGRAVRRQQMQTQQTTEAMKRNSEVVFLQ